MFRGKDEGLRLLRDTINAINAATGTDYSFQVAKLNAADYGIPQTRERVFIIGSRDGKEFKFPTPSHRDPSANKASTDPLSSTREPWRTAWDAIGDLNQVDDPTLRVGGNGDNCYRQSRMAKTICGTPTAGADSHYLAGGGVIGDFF
jgi:DNA (cytosine-5)-methyltransferase 1